MAAVDALLTDGRAALRRGDAAGARAAFEQATAAGAGAAAAEGLARVHYLELDFGEATALWEEAYSGYRAAGDELGAIRVARTLGAIHGSVLGDWAVSGGWLARAGSLLAETVEGPEHGWLALNTGMFEPDRARKEEHFRTALATARRHHDRDLEFTTLAYLGASLVHGDRPDEGMPLLDEALAAVAGREVDDFCALEEIFCQLFAACEHARDVVRADQWIRVGETIARRRRLPAVSAFCRTHYGGVLTAAGRWPEADTTLTEAARLWTLGHRSWLRGGALARLADLRVRQGRVEEAAALLEGMDRDDAEVAGPLAAVHAARGQLALAQMVLERAVDQVGERSRAAAPLLAQLVDVHLATGDPVAAGSVVQQVTACATQRADPFLRALAEQARGRVLAAAGSGEAAACLRGAADGFARAGLPLELARCRLELARVVAEQQPEVATAEARAALDTFERLQAARDADAAAAFLRSLGVRVPAARRNGGTLTQREAEVLTLLGHGLTNPEISDRLFISRKTVEHHVGNVLAKLGLRSRAEVAAYAARLATTGERPVAPPDRGAGEPADR